MVTEPSYRFPMPTPVHIVLDCRRRGRGVQYLVRYGGRPAAWKSQSAMAGHEELLQGWSPRAAMHVNSTPRCGKRTRECPIAQAAIETVDEVWPAPEREDAVILMLPEEARVPSQSISPERRLSQRSRQAVQLYVAGPAPPPWELAAAARMTASSAEGEIKMSSRMASSEASHSALLSPMLEADHAAIVGPSMGVRDGVATAPPLLFKGMATTHPVLSSKRLTGHLQCGMDGVRQMLTTLRLESYADAFEEHGFDDLDFLASLSHERLAQVATLLQSPRKGELDPPSHPMTPTDPARTGSDLKSHRG